MWPSLRPLAAHTLGPAAPVALPCSHRQQKGDKPSRSGDSLPTGLGPGVSSQSLARLACRRPFSNMRAVRAVGVGAQPPSPSSQHEGDPTPAYRLRPGFLDQASVPTGAWTATALFISWGSQSSCHGGRPPAPARPRAPMTSLWPRRRQSKNRCRLVRAWTRLRRHLASGPPPGGPKVTRGTRTAALSRSSPP